MSLPPTASEEFRQRLHAASGLLWRGAELAMKTAGPSENWNGDTKEFLRLFEVAAEFINQPTARKIAEKSE